jgi:O-antigen ligase
MNFICRQIEVVVSVAFLCIAEAILWPPGSYFSNSGTPTFDVSDPLNLAVHAALLGFLAIVMVVRRHEMLAALRVAWLVMLLVALAYLSAFWSPAPDLVLRRSTTFAITTIFAIYLAVRFDLGRLASILVVINAFAAVGSLVELAVARNLATNATIEYPHAVRGVYSDKNTLGGLMAVGIIVAFYAWRRGHGSRLLAALVIPANLLLLYLSQSATALIVTTAGAYVAATASAFRLRNTIGFVAGFVLLIAGVAALGMLAFGWSDLLEALGRSATLTGRLPIWRLSVHFIEQRPWLGWGYGAFWRHASVETRTFWTALHWPVPHAHNGWLEVGLELGGLGIAGITVLWLAAFWRAVRLLNAPAARHVVFCLAMLAGTLIENLTEYEFLRADCFYWIFFVTVFVYLGRERAAYRRAKPAERRPPVPLPAVVAMPQMAPR